MERLYELMFILDPDLEEQEREEVIERVKGEIKGEVEAVDKWEKRKLAYPINKKREGYYVVMQFKTDAGSIGELDRFLKLEERILRHMIIRKEM